VNAWVRVGSDDRERALLTNEVRARVHLSLTITPGHREPNDSRLILSAFEQWRATMSEATLILPNMRGGCATVGNTVHTLFRVSGRRHMPMANPAATRAPEPTDAPVYPQAQAAVDGNEAQ
jgi:hypothetical protein